MMRIFPPNSLKTYLLPETFLACRIQIYWKRPLKVIAQS
uniref:Uncharacterized protein n=1 Tax=Anguilla anguilla TaxID=7936 RepID=A0A0E9W3D7_ANGAN